MKKFLGLLSIFLLPFFVMWQNIAIDENSTDTDNTINETNRNTRNTTTDKEKAWNDNRSKGLHFWFCNEWTDNLSTYLNYAVNVGDPFKICALFYNNSDEDIKIQIRIVDQWITDDWNATCYYDSLNIQSFIRDPNVLSDFKEVTIPAGETLIKEFELMFPVGVEWKQSACFSYNRLSEQDNNVNAWGWGITPIINNVSFMDFFVWSLGDIKNEIIVKDILTKLNDNQELELSFNLSNIWNLEDKVEIKWKVSNIFGFKKDFTIDWTGIQLVPGRTVPVSANLWSIPLYGWLFNIKFTMTATPFFSYDISKSNIDPTLLEEKTFDASTTYFQMPWMIFALVAMFIIILYLLFRKPKK